MFSGIIEKTARVVLVETDGGNKHFTLESEIASELHIDQSLAHNGVCLTVVGIDDNRYKVTAISETLQKSNIGELVPGDLVNLERSMRPDSLLDGHIVQGHVDQVAVCTSVIEADGSWYYTFDYDPSQGNITVEKGSVAVNGVSLTVVNSRENSFQVAIIPYTYEHTNFHCFKVGTKVNLEFDIIGKYISRLMERYLAK